MVAVVVVPLHDDLAARALDRPVAQLAERPPWRLAHDGRADAAHARKQRHRRVERGVGVVHDDELALGVRLMREVADRRARGAAARPRA